MEALVMVKRILLLLFVIACWSYLVANAAPVYAKALVLKYNDTVNIYITSAPCGIPKYEKDFPYAAKAVKKIGDKSDFLAGCFTGRQNEVVIQWQDINGKPSDQSTFSADDFQQIEGTI
jgi:hypothetical protein